MPRISKKAFETVGDFIKPPPPPPKRKAGAAGEAWNPRLNPKQQELFDSEKKFILVHGEKGSAKTYGSLNKLVRHAYENQNAFCLIVVRVRSMATKGGAWDKLVNMILPAWRDGNRDRSGKLFDEGMGLQFTQPQKDTQQNEYLWIQNMHGGWSMVVLISAPHANLLKERIRGYEPSFVFVDELTSCDSPIYFDSIAAQVGRRPGIDTVQQYVAACNPEGPSHWVYKKFFEEPYNEETDSWDQDFETIYFPIDDNMANLPPDYQERLKKIFKGDELELARMVDGIWVDRPSGDAIFANIYNPQIHIKPLASGGMPDLKNRLMPAPNAPFIIGMDPGSVYNAFIFMQWLRIDGRLRWLVFDEIVTCRKRIAYEMFIPAVARRIVFWRKLMREQYGRDDPDYSPPGMIWVSDSSAFNQFRAAAGSFDVLEMEKAYDKIRTNYGLEYIKIHQAPKSNGSKAERTRILQSLLTTEDVIISSGCPKVQKMLLQQESEKQKVGESFDPTRALTPARSDHVHVLDALTYPMLLAAVTPSMLNARDSGQSLIGGRK